MTEIHPTAAEILAEAYECIESDQLSDSRALREVNEVLERKDYDRVQRAKKLLEQERLERAAGLLESVLYGTAFDPNDPDSHYPIIGSVEVEQ